MRRQNGNKRPYIRTQRETAARGMRRGLLLYYWGALLRLWAGAFPDPMPHMPPPPVSGVQGDRDGGAVCPARICVFFFFACFFFLLVIYIAIYIIIYLYMYLLYVSIYIYLYMSPLLALAAAAAPHMHTRTSARRADHTTATPGAMQKNKGDSPSKKRV